MDDDKIVPFPGKSKPQPAPKATLTESEKAIDATVRGMIGSAMRTPDYTREREVLAQHTRSQMRSDMPKIPPRTR